MADRIVGSTSRTWEATGLWQELDQRVGAAEDFRPVLRQIFPEVQTLLAAGGTAPLDFTLHDADHAFRVAQRMIDLLPEGVLGRLSPQELALLLLAAYLHDIGMTPARSKVTLHYQYLLSGDPQTLTPAEVEVFRAWLDGSDREVAVPLCRGTPTPEALRLADELITYYCRARHNDWSAEWIEAHLRGRTLGSYAGWVEDLVTLCRSHHEGYAELVGQEFDPRIVGASGWVVHLRYLACLLRVADVLEFDPERTPEVVFQHRGIARSSRIYWHKDHHIAFRRDGQKLVIAARPPDARLHRAIELTADDVERELNLCRRLAEETHFDRCPGLEERLPHRWDLQTHVYRDIRPLGEAYEYIDGSFRPNTQKVLELLAGVELYGTPLAAVRELLQNAFDAVREQTAYERLAERNPADPTLARDLAHRRRVELTLEPDAEGVVWLTCADDGVGMTKEPEWPGLRLCEAPGCWSAGASRTQPRPHPPLTPLHPPAKRNSQDDFPSPSLPPFPQRLQFRHGRRRKRAQGRTPHGLARCSP
jgi:hypothetical protein